MAKTTRAGELHDLVAFEKRGTTSDGHGGTISGFTEQFRCRARIQHLRGSEVIQAARLEGRHPQIVTVRSATQTQQVTADWRIRNVRTGALMNIRSVEPDENRALIAFMAESGVAQ